MTIVIFIHIDTGHYSVLVVGNNINTLKTFNLPREINVKTKSRRPKQYT